MQAGILALSVKNDLSKLLTSVLLQVPYWEDLDNNNNAAVADADADASSCEKIKEKKTTYKILPAPVK